MKLFDLTWAGRTYEVLEDGHAIRAYCAEHDHTLIDGDLIDALSARVCQLSAYEECCLILARHIAESTSALADALESYSDLAKAQARRTRQAVELAVKTLEAANE